MIQVVCSKIKLEISPFLTVIQFCININVLARAHKKFQRGRHAEIYSLALKEQDKSKMELPLVIVSNMLFCTSIAAGLFLRTNMSSDFISKAKE